MNNARARLLLALFISFVALTLLFTTVLNFYQFLFALTTVNLLLFLASDVPYFVQSLAYGYRLTWAMNKAGRKTSFSRAYFAHLFGMLGSNFSVGRTAYLSASLPLKGSLTGSVGVLSACIFVDVIAKALFGIASSLYFFWFFGLFNPLAVLFALCILIAGSLFLFILFNPASLVLASKVPIIGEKIAPRFVQFRQSWQLLRGKMLFLFYFPLFGWILRGFEWQLLGSAVGINFSWFTWFMLHPLLTLVRLIPVTVTGLGIFELTLIALFPQINPAQLVAFGILDMLNNSLVDILGVKALWQIRK